MKNSAIQIANQIVNDNKEYIEGNISEYLIENASQEYTNLFQYLTEEEVNEATRSLVKANQLSIEVHSMLVDNFNYDISEFEY